MARYRLGNSGTTIIDTVSNTTIPIDTGNPLYQEYLAWVAAGGVADVATQFIQFGARTEFGPLVIRTTNATPGEIYRVQMALNTGYAFALRFLAVDAGNGAVKRLEATITVKRLAGGQSQIGTTTVTTNHADTGTTAWNIVPTFDTSGGKFDGVISVVGVVGRNIDWCIYGEVVRFAPGGLT